MSIAKQTLAATAIVMALLTLCSFAHASRSAVDEMLLERGCVKVAVTADYPAGQWDCPPKGESFDRLPPVVPEDDAPAARPKNKAPTRDMLSAAIELACRKVGKSGNTSLCGEENTGVQDISAEAIGMMGAGM